jgi:hypothetical protein
MEQCHIQHVFRMNANLDQSNRPQTFRAAITFPVAVVDKKAQYISHRRLSLTKWRSHSLSGPSRQDFYRCGLISNIVARV